MKSEEWAWLTGIIEAEGSIFIARCTKVPKPLNKEWLMKYEKALKLKEETGWGARRIAEILGMSEVTLERWFYGKMKPRNKIANPSGELFTPSLSVVNTNRKLIEKVANLCGLQKIETKPPRSHLGKKTTYVVRTTNAGRVLEILEHIYPFLVSKKGQAEVVMELCRLELSTPLSVKRTSTKYHEAKRRLYETLRTRSATAPSRSSFRA